GGVGDWNVDRRRAADDRAIALHARRHLLAADCTQLEHDLAGHTLPSAAVTSGAVSTSTCRVIPDRVAKDGRFRCRAVLGQVLDTQAQFCPEVSRRTTFGHGRLRLL